MKKRSWVRPEPKLPPAPVMPEMMPRERREMKGMTPKMAPQAAWAQMEKRTMATMETGRELARPSQRQKAPPRVSRIQTFQRRARMPQRRAPKSDRNPPRGRATMLAMPKHAAIVPAVRRLRSKRSKKYSAITLSVVSSTPMQYPYSSTNTHVR